MSNIIEVNKEEKELLFKMAKEGIHIGEGAEGNCYLSVNEHGGMEVLKIIDKDVRYGINNVILDSTINLKSFVFPKKVYMFEGKVIAYTARYYMDYLKSNIIKLKPMVINSDLFNNAVSRFIDELKVLSEFGIHINDLDYNLVFDNYNLVAIDTLGYEVRDYNTFDENIATLKSALKETFRFKSEIILDKKVDFDKEVDRMLVYKSESYMPKHLKKGR